MFFNIPIRTILLDGKRAEMGIGGGIVWDSTPEGEWAEGLLKAKFVTKTCQIG
jgi:para-aminobenzoate synthetase/4-amino-4-deoxychorismate lyase